MTDAPSLTLVRRFAAPPEAVFAAWTDATMLARWFGPHRTHVADARVDARVGGEFRIVIVEDADVRAGAGHRHAACGRFRVIDPPHRLVFDWWWGAAPDRVSLVEVSLRKLPGGTELTLLHGSFADAATATRHVRGWTESLERLGTLWPEGNTDAHHDAAGRYEEGRVPGGR
jgi:uncharacterized protein YndB with AHSA1/START domain